MVITFSKSMEKALLIAYLYTQTCLLSEDVACVIFSGIKRCLYFTFGHSKNIISFKLILLHIFTLYVYSCLHKSQDCCLLRKPLKAAVIIHPIIH